MTANLKVVKLLPKDNSLYSDAIQLLEDVIQSIKEDDVFGVAIVTLHQDKSVGTAWSFGMEEELHKAIGAVETLKHRLINELLEI